MGNSKHLSSHILNRFKVSTQLESPAEITASIEQGIPFRGFNLWMLIIAIFIASLGLNVNSTAVIIGAMLISPLMGPIMGMGFGVATHDVGTLQSAVKNYVGATIVALLTSTLFFAVSPLNEAHSEILSRTTPTIYDVLIALFGGLAGMLAVCSKNKGNVLPGVAIATALMPPLCTAGYGLATAQFSYFLGAFYLYFINTVFISIASFIVLKLLHFPVKKMLDFKKELFVNRIMLLIVVVTLLPSIYFGYNLVMQTRYTQSATKFINNEAHFPNDYLLNKKIDPQQKTIQLTFGGNQIDSTQILALTKKLPLYGLASTHLTIKQGFVNDDASTGNKNFSAQANEVLLNTQQELHYYKNQVEVIQQQQNKHAQLYQEIKTLYPNLQSLVISPAVQHSDSAATPIYITLANFANKPQATEVKRLTEFLKIRLGEDSIRLEVR